MRPRSTVLVLLIGLATLLGQVLLAPPVTAGPTDPLGVWPLDPVPEVVGDFAPPSDPYGAGHRGVDLVGSPGQSVRAALPGEVTFAGRLAGRGVVTVTHGDTRTTYEPVTAGVALGTAVAAGDVVGTLEAAGSHCAPRTCLHWGWLRGSEYLDPLRLVGGGPVRLVPLGGLPATAGPTRPYGAWAPAAAAPVPGLALWRALAAVRGVLH